MNFTKFLFFILCTFLHFPELLAQTPIIYNGKAEVIGNKVEILTDTKSTVNLQAALKAENFIQSSKQFPNLSITANSYWIKFRVKNVSAENYAISITQPTIDQADFYQLGPDGKVINHLLIGSKIPFSSRIIKHQNFIFPAVQTTDSVNTFFIRVKSGKQLILSVYLSSINDVQQMSLTKDILFGVYLGIILSMLLYNLFIYSTIKDNNYIYYVVYLFLVLLTQASLEGYLFRFILPNQPAAADAFIYLSSAFLGISAVEFSKNFLSTKKFVPLLHRLSYIFWLIYALTIVLFAIGNYNLSYTLILVSAMLSAFYVLFMAIRVVMLGSRSAAFFLIAWSVFIVCVFIYVLKDFDILPYNTFTNSALLLGSAIEALMISFALADKINIYKKEKEASQEETLIALKENERIVLEQNVILEQKVIERTDALIQANNTLNFTLNDLKEAQSQLVDSEKMAGLGQLTAGIAHEINNPINFVTSNIKPLELDILDLSSVITMYEQLDLNQDMAPQIARIEAFKRQIDIVFVKEEISSLLSGIGEGAKRTAEIIRSLKNFSRLDENDTKPVDLNEGLSSTLILVKNTFPDNLKVVRDFGNIPNVECLPGKINQVFMNLITNAIHAIKSKSVQNNEEILTIRTWQEGEFVKISIKDTGTGMPEEVKQKIFEPFFTTKDVGEGTGLGLSIVFRIIENHQGSIDVITKVNEGTEFIINLPINNN